MNKLYFYFYFFSRLYLTIIVIYLCADCLFGIILMSLKGSFRSGYAIYLRYAVQLSLYTNVVYNLTQVERIYMFSHSKYII